MARRGGPRGASEQYARQRRALIVRAFLIVWQNRLARAAAVLLLVLLIVLPLGASSLFSRLGAPSCQEIEHVDLPIEEVIEMKERKEAYQLDPQESFLALSGDELSFLIRDMYDFSARIWFYEGKLRMDAAVPRGRICYNITFLGEIEVQERRLIVMPEQLVVGEVDLTALGLAGPFEFGSADVEDGQLAEALDNTRAAQVVGERLRVELYDPWQLPW